MSYASRDQMIGRTLDDRYRVRSRIARGGMGMVYLADDLRLGRKVAIKVMHPHLVDDATFVRRFEKEAHAAARLNGPNVVNVFDQGFDGESPYLVMEYVPGITLRQLLKQQKRLTADQAIEISEAVLSGLATAHQAGFIHRDVKPENVFLADDGGIKIGDFGLARVASANTTTGQALLGTIAYLSPELVTRGVADARTDVYAFGIMLYEMLTGVQPYRGEQAVQIAYMHAHEDVPKPSLISNEATPELDELVRWTTARDPDKRPRDAKVVLTRMQQLLGTGLDAATRELEHAAPTAEQPTAATTILRQTEQQRIAKARTEPPKPPHLPETPLTKLQENTEVRAKRGKVVALVVLILALLLGFGGWWFGSGPGAQVRVPDVAGASMEQAETMLSSLGFLVATDTCHSVSVDKGSAVSSTPAAGERQPRGTKVTVCESLGPQMLEVPQVTALSEAQAEATITEAGFRYGGVSDTRFHEAEKGTVAWVVGEEGEQVSGPLAEGSILSVVTSAGLIPEVSGMTPEEATAALSDAGITVDAEQNDEAFHDSVPNGQVISRSDTAQRPGDTVSLTISKGPELVTIPDVIGESTRAAMRALSGLGLKPVTDVPELLRGAVPVAQVEPGVGEQVKVGTEVTLGYTP